MCTKNILVVSLWLSWLIPAQPLGAVIVRVGFVQNTMPELRAKKFVLWGDCHVHMPEDERQLEHLAQVLLKRDRESDEDMHILIECPPARMYMFPSVMSHLMDRLKGCRRTVVQNIEMRCMTGAACTVLNPDISPGFFWPRYCDSGYGTCLIEDVTKLDVDYEISYYKRLVDEQLSTMVPRYADAIRILEPEYQACMHAYKERCAFLSLVPETRILDLSRKLYEEVPQQRAYLFKAIHDLSSVLFDMHICVSVMALTHPRIIGLVAGVAHTDNLHGILQRMGNRSIASYGCTWSPEVRPIPAAYVDIEPGCSSCCMCPIL